MSLKCLPRCPVNEYLSPPSHIYIQVILIVVSVILIGRGICGGRSYCSSGWIDPLGADEVEILTEQG